MKKTILLCACAGLTAGLLTGCNTMEGMGTDIKHGGENLHNSAQQEKEKMHRDDENEDYNDNSDY